MLNRNYSSYVKSVKDTAKVQKKIQFIRTQQGQTNLLTNFLQNSKETLPTIGNAYRLIDQLITTNADVVMTNDQKTRAVTEMVTEVKKMIDQFYRTGNETAPIKMLEDKLTSVVDNIIKNQPQHALISSYYGAKPVTSSEGSLINNDIQDSIKQLANFVENIDKHLNELKEKTRDQRDNEFIDEARYKLGIIKAQTQEGFDFFEFDRNMHNLTEIAEKLKSKLQRVTVKNFILEKLRRLDRKFIDEDYNVSPDIIKTRTALEPVCFHNWASQRSCTE